MSYHFDLFGDNKFIYVYMYKNACSVFKNIVFESFQENEVSTPLQALGKRRVVDISEIERAGFRFFVVREPLGRVVSGFLNQVVTKIDHDYPEMFKGIELATGKKLTEVTFNNFVDDYLMQGISDWRKINAHFLPMSESLLPVYYDAVIDIKNLKEASAVVFGEVFSEKYFSKKINQTSDNVMSEMGDLTNIPIDLLNKSIVESRKFPCKNDFITPSIKEKLSFLYASDINIYCKVEVADTFVPFDNRA